MKERTTSEDLNVTKEVQEIVTRLDKFFGVTPYVVDWKRFREGKSGIAITYTDFFSKQLTRQMLTDVLPKGLYFTLKREYSDKAIARILLNEYKKNRVAIVDCYNGELHPETVCDFVNRKLDMVEMIGS